MHQGNKGSLRLSTLQGLYYTIGPLATGLSLNENFSFKDQTLPRNKTPMTEIDVVFEVFDRPTINSLNKLPHTDKTKPRNKLKQSKQKADSLYNTRQCDIQVIKLCQVRTKLIALG